MEISLENRNINTFREIYRQTRRIQENAESVVPDTDDDIGKVITVQSTVMLKSKDITSRGVLISGEAAASVLYITEAQDSVSFVKLSKAFTIEYEIADIGADAAAQIKLEILNTETRVLNPRKLSVIFEIAGELSCFRQEQQSVEAVLPECEANGLHARYETKDLMFTDAALEKTFAVSEQFQFPKEKPAPSKIAYGRARFSVLDKQLIGTKIIVKGDLLISVCYLSDEVSYPLKAEFSTPFSQILDIGEDKMDICTCDIELTSAFYSITDTMNGDKMLDTEIYALVQLVSRSRKTVGYISDVYCNRMPASCSTESRQLKQISDSRQIRLSANERLNVTDDCKDVVDAYVTVAHITQEQSKLKALFYVDILYRNGEGQLRAVRREAAAESECDIETLRITGVWLSEVYVRPDDQFIDIRLSVELGILVCLSDTIEKVETVTLDEQNKFEQNAFPSVMLVRAEHESLWELAKKYHSTVEKIREVNPAEGETDSKFLLIPKSI